jgi:prepilin-type N-terminal cleavage/methylation domain-containing protein
MSVRYALGSNARGFSLVELLMVVAVLGTVAAMAVLVSPVAINQARSDSGLAQAVDIVRGARDLAISSRRNIQLRFLGNNGIQTARVEIPGPATTIVRTVELEGRMRIALVPGVPDTPDRFGNPSATAFGPTPSRMFTSEGTLVDANGDVLNGTLFLGDPSDPRSARAITIFGATGAIRTWQWDGGRWQEAAW